MNDNDIIRLIISILRTGLNGMGMSNVLIKQSYNPLQTGVPTAPTIYLHKISTPRYGWPKRKSVYNADNSNFDHSEVFWRTPTFQIDGLSVQDPTDTAQLTASDIVLAAADILQTDLGINTLKQSGVGIDRIIQVRDSYFVDDRERHEQSPSFDFTLSYQKTITSTAGVVDDFELNVNRV